MNTGFNPRARRGARVAWDVLRVAGRNTVSILARAEARALPGAAAFKAHRADVSILARAEARALRWRSKMSETLYRFQSSRAPRRARCQHVSSRVNSLFIVSILARAEARALHWDVLRVAGRNAVSILARAEARALPFAVVRVVQACRVSILARAEARALPAWARWMMTSHGVSILARAEARALRLEVENE